MEMKWWLRLCKGFGNTAIELQWPEVYTHAVVKILQLTLQSDSDGRCFSLLSLSTPSSQTSKTLIQLNTRQPMFSSLTVSIHMKTQHYISLLFSYHQLCSLFDVLSIKCVVWRCVVFSLVVLFLKLFITVSLEDKLLSCPVYIFEGAPLVISSHSCMLSSNHPSFLPVHSQWFVCLQLLF